MYEHVKHIMAPVIRRVMLMAAKCRIENTDETSGRQRMQVSAYKNEVLDKVPSLGHFGFSSCPLPGAEAVTLFLNGNRDNGIIIATDDGRHRPKGLIPGESILYNSAHDYILLSKSGKILMHASEIDSDCDIVAGGISLMHHVHPEYEGVTGPPTGSVSGGGGGMAFSWMKF